MLTAMREPESEVTEEQVNQPAAGFTPTLVVDFSTFSAQGMSMGRWRSWRWT
jgi:hypothetical protein